MFIAFTLPLVLQLSVKTEKTSFSYGIWFLTLMLYGGDWGGLS